MRTDQTYLRTVLLSELQRRRSRNPAYSTRAFASALRLNSGALSGILNGKRRVSARMALSLAERLQLDPERRAALERAVKPASEAPAQAYDPLDMDQFRLVSEWQYFAVLSLAKKDGVAHDAEHVAARLGIPPAQARRVIDALLRFGLVEDRAGRLVRTQQRISTSDGVASMAIRQAHREDCDLAARSLERDPVPLRDFSSITFRLDPASLQEIAAIVRRAQDQALDLSEARDGREVYRMSVHVFPLSQVSLEEKKP